MESSGSVQDDTESCSAVACSMQHAWITATDAEAVSLYKLEQPAAKHTGSGEGKRSDLPESC